MEPRAATPLRITRLADRLDDLAAELIEPVLRELSLDLVLQLACTPAATPATSRLRWAIENSPSWRSILGMGRLEHFRTLWESLVHLSWFWCSQSIHNIPFLEGSNLWRTAAELISDFGARDVLSKLEETFRLAFQTIMGIATIPPPSRRQAAHNQSGYDPVCPPALADAICAFIPPEVVILVDSRNYEKLSQIAQAGHNDTSNRRDQWTVQPMTETSKVTSTFASASPLLSHYNRVNHAGKWEVRQLQSFLPHFIRAYDHLNAIKSDELVRLAELYETYPAWLKTPLAPQSPAPRPNTQHISAALRRDAKLVRGQFMGSQVRKGRRSWYRFRNSHPALVPTDEALQMFAAHRDDTLPYPKDLQPHARRVRDGFWRLYERDGTLGQDVRCVSEGSPGVPRHAGPRDGRGRDFPSPEAELQWLGSLMHCVQWISKHALSSSRRLPRPLLDTEDYRSYVASQPVQVIAEQLLADREICEATTTSGLTLPSLTALYMPPYSSQRTREVAKCVWPDMDIAVLQFLWDGMIKKIKRGLAKPPPIPLHEDEQILACDAPGQPASDIPADSWENSVQQYQNSRTAATSGIWAQVKCYICRMRITKPHETLRAMCQPCGEFNLAGSSLSLPQNLDLRGKTALVTGGRINLGFHVALRLLRCGARVIVSTRYPRDAVARYRSEPDVDEWADRLRVVGADFRSARDAFELVAQAKAVVQEWGGPLDILINNAAQTLTDSLETEKMAVRRETLLGSYEDPMLAKWLSAYQPRIRGGMNADKAPEGLGPVQAPAERFPPRMVGVGGGEALGFQSAQMSKMETSRASQPSSWVQSIMEIPYEDIISAHSVNTFVPLILVRELLPIMNHKGQSRAEKSSSSCSPQQSLGAGYIVNVSSREGIFEARDKHQSKAGKHVHTNMSKAGLNMITETEASGAWQNYRVAMNTVDPGYMSAAPELEQSHGGERPLGWEDGAGRVLWPLAMGERKGSRVLRGRFLKHYGAVRVDTRLGRG